MLNQTDYNKRMEKQDETAPQSFFLIDYHNATLVKYHTTYTYVTMAQGQLTTSYDAFTWNQAGGRWQTGCHLVTRAGW